MYLRTVLFLHSLCISVLCFYDLRCPCEKKREKSDNLLTVIQSLSSRDSILTASQTSTCIHMTVDLVEISDSVGLSQGCDSAFLTSSREMSMFLVLVAHSKWPEHIDPDL